MEIKRQELLEKFNQIKEDCKYLLKIPKTYYPEELFLEKEFNSKKECVEYIENLVNDIHNDRDLCTDVDYAKICRHTYNNLQEYEEKLSEDNLFTELQDCLKYNKYSIQFIFIRYTKQV